MCVQIKFYGISAFEIITENDIRIFVDPLVMKEKIKETGFLKI
ncbi:hypothetical protein ES702_05344 [subsurface metagenome]